ncbi:S8 family serine peptidase [Fischerella sp. PCC 9605]|uniref:S8 family serine peptidase n=1 Tax=Fischerella sp. PCC 9605 TaxID=1173024 RepID=UPI00047D33AB|nr:S8 family serine peptidase [Fischerella sp. PCC 9605]
MGDKLDPQLWYLMYKHNSDKSELASPELAEWVGLRQTQEQLNTVEVLVRCIDANRSDALRSIGMNIHFDIQEPYTIASGEVTLDTLDKLKELDFVARVEASHPMLTDLQDSRDETCTEPLHLSDPKVRGEGVIVGIIDTGIDYTHESFRNDDGTSRILYLWDQGAEKDPNGRVPYGREYTKAQLDAVLKLSNPLTEVSHQDGNGHGTHVAGIAAGNGCAEWNQCIHNNNKCAKQCKYTGIAPEADLIVVAFQMERISSPEDSGRPLTLGRSVRAFNAFAYITQRASESSRPVAINLSMGTCIGGHAGETLLEQFLDQLLRQPKIVAVKSAGNEQERLSHAGGEIQQGQTLVLEFEVDSNNPRDMLEVWYDAADTISISLQPPDSVPLAFTAPNDIYERFRTNNNNDITLKFDYDVDLSGDTSATIFLLGGRAKYIQSGKWKLLLRGDSVEVGRYDVWISGICKQSRFLRNSADDSCTITIPGNAKRIITVGSYVISSSTNPQPSTSLEPGNISSFSSRGPTRYGLQKPEIAAPGEEIISARSKSADPDQCPAYHDSRHYTPMMGTSMAAPHVTGAAALILSVNQGLTCEQVKQILMQTARRDDFVCSAPNLNYIWGSGKLDVKAAVERARTIQFSQISNVQINGATLSWQTDIPTTTVVRFHTHQGKLQLGKVVGTQEDSTLQTNHTLTLSGLSPGTYYCEISGVSEDNWQTTDDNYGDFYIVEITN